MPSRHSYSTLERVIAIALAGVMARSAFAHLANSYQFYDAILNYHILNSATAKIAAMVVPWIQMVIVASLCLGVRVRAAYALAAAMFTAFTAAQVFVLTRGDASVSCGCFGASASSTVGAWSLALAAGCTIVTILGLVVTRAPVPVQSVPHRSGFSLVELLVAIAIVGLLTGFILSAVQKVRAAAQRATCESRMKQVAVALHQMHDATGKLPAGLTSPESATDFAALGWSARILPFADQSAL